MRFFSFVLLLLFVFSGLNTMAQQFHGGVNAGVAGTQVAGDSYSGFNKAGIYLGGYVNTDISERSALQMEITYFQKGSRVNPDSSNNFTQYIFRANYIELPVLYQFKAGKYRVFGGPSLGFLMGYYEESNYQRLDIISNYNKPASVTLQINLGLRFFITEKIGAEIRTNNSLLNLRSRNVTGDVWRFWTYGQFHDSIVLSMFYQFR
jgi:hypothetical protein